LRKFKEQFREK